jgi:putative flippase GtrA
VGVPARSPDPIAGRPVVSVDTPSRHPSLARGAPIWWPGLNKVARYVSVSLVGTSTTVVLLWLFVGVGGFPAVWSNLVAAGLSTALSFELDRRWVWSRQPDLSLARQTALFWTWSLCELGLSTLAVRLVSSRVEAAGWTREAHTVAVEVASVGISLVTWFVQFVVFDRYIFMNRRR